MLCPLPFLVVPVRSTLSRLFHHPCPPSLQGTLVLEYVGEVLTVEAYRDRAAGEYAGRRHFHCLTLDRGLVIDGGKMGASLLRVSRAL